MTLDKLMEIRKGGDEWRQIGYAQLCKEGEDDGFTILSFRYAAQVSVPLCCEGEEVVVRTLFMEVEPSCNTSEPAFEAVVLVEGKYFFGDGATPLRVVWRP